MIAYIAAVVLRCVAPPPMCAPDTALVCDGSVWRCMPTTLPGRPVIALALALAGCTPPTGPGFALPSGRCSAVAVSADQALTAGHCVRQSIAWDAGRDLALIYAPGATRTHVPLARAAVIGETVEACSAIHEQCHAGVVLREGVGWYETTITVSPGWSGSPVVGRDGALIGVVTACSGSSVWAGLTQRKTCRPGWSIAAKVTP